MYEGNGFKNFHVGREYLFLSLGPFSGMGEWILCGKREDPSADRPTDRDHSRSDQIRRQAKSWKTYVIHNPDRNRVDSCIATVIAFILGIVT